MAKLKLHLCTLPRWFAAPAAVSAVVLGLILGNAALWLWPIAIISGLFLMAWAHQANSWLDWSWTAFDRGTEEERSKEKSYTGGQSVIEKYAMSPREVALGALGWLAASAALAAVISTFVSPWIWLPWALVALCTFWYSWGKQHYNCELALGMGFGSFAVMYGMAASQQPNFGLAFLAGLPFTWLWGGCS